MKIRPIFKTIDIFSFIQFLSRQTNYIIKFFLLKVLYLVSLTRVTTQEPSGAVSVMIVAFTVPLFV